MAPVMKLAQKILYIVAALIAAINILLSISQVANHTFNKSGTPLHSLSYQFQGLKDVFKGVAFAGYYTDKNIEHPVAIAQYEQAQYVLAPTVLILNKTDYPLVILDCTSPEVAIAKMKELGLQPIKGHNGLILAFNPKAPRI
jgi:hypothetical protein